MSSTPPPIADALSAELLRTRDARAEEWLAAMPAGVQGTAPENAPSPSSAAPAVVEWLARFLTADADAGNDDAALKAFAEAGRGSGRSAVERLAQVDALEAMLLHDLRRIASARGDQTSAESVLDVVQRIAAGAAQLRSAVAAVAVEDGEHTHRLQTFVRTLSHELKNPLGAAASGAALLREDGIRNDGERFRKFTDLVERNIARAVTLIADLRSLLLMERDTPADADVPIPEVIESVLIEVQSAAAEKEVRIDVDEASLPRTRVDGPRMTLILMNLAWNAVNYSDPEKPERWVRIGAEEGGGGTRLYVADNGRGIPPDAQERIFERFFRAHPEVQGGTGLGLAIAAEAARRWALPSASTASQDGERPFTCSSLVKARAPTAGATRRRERQSTRKTDGLTQRHGGREKAGQRSILVMLSGCSAVFPRGVTTIPTHAFPGRTAPARRPALRWRCCGPGSG